MSTFKVNFEISKTDAQLFISSLSHLAQNTVNEKRRKTILRVIREIKFDHKLETIIFNELVLVLSPMTTSPIRKNSHIDNELSINRTWLANSLHLICNHVIIKLLKLSGSKKKAQAISSATAMESTTIKDVITLIRDSYESAK